MSSKRYPEEFKIQAAKQITDRGHPVAEVAARLGVSQHSLYQWLKQFDVPEAKRTEVRSQQEENRRLRAELKRVTEERDILKNGRSVLCQGIPVRYAFIRAHEEQHAIRTLCRVMTVHPSRYYAWRADPASSRQKEDQRVVGLTQAILAGKRRCRWLSQDHGRPEGTG